MLVLLTLGYRRLLLLPHLLGQHLLHHTTLQHQLVLKLSLLSLRELRQFLNDVLAIFESESSNYFPCLAIPLSLRNIVMLFTHMQVASRVCGVLLAAVIEAGELFLELLGTSSHVLLPRRFSLTDLRSQLVLHLQILNNASNELILRLSDEVRGQSLGEGAF